MSNRDIFIGVFNEKGIAREGLTYFFKEKRIFDSKFEYNESKGQLIAIGIFYFSNGAKQKRKRIINNKKGERKLKFL